MNQFAEWSSADVSAGEQASNAWESFFQASGEAALIKAGAKVLLETAKGDYEY